MSVSSPKFVFQSGLFFVSRRSPLATLRYFLLMACAIVSLWLSSPAAAWGATAPELFETNCAGCHPNGANIIRRGKNLQQKALKRHGYTSVDAIANLISHGKGLMSAYDERLTPDEINILAQYVLDRAVINWKPDQ